MKTYPIGHYAIKPLGYGAGFVKGEIIGQTDNQVKVKTNTGESTWRKLTLSAVVPPENAAKIMERLTSAGAEMTDRQRRAKVWHQIEVHNILKGYEV